MNLKFKIGDKVNYIIADKILFTATIIRINKGKNDKPYTMQDELGNIKYANEIYCKKSF